MAAVGRSRRAPRIQLNLLHQEQDLLALRETVRVTRALLRHAAIASAVGADLLPGPDVDRDAEVETFLRASANSANHPLGPCAIGDHAAVEWFLASVATRP